VILMFLVLKHADSPAGSRQIQYPRQPLKLESCGPAIACVVETGSPRCFASVMAPAAPVLAQRPVRGLSRVRRLPIVWTMRQPPLNFPRCVVALELEIPHLPGSLAEIRLSAVSVSSLC
jgi:hypothetical protein